MTTTSRYIELPKGRVHARCFGRGAALLVALHGYGDSGRAFQPLEPALADHFRVYAVDLPFHGKTRWEAPEYDADDLAALIDAILKREGQTRFYWLGYSYGGRLILSTLDRFDGRVAAAYLVATDGLGTHGMRLPLLLPAWLRRRLADHLHRPQWLLSLSGWLYRRRLLDAFRHNFLRQQLANEERRRRLAGTWRTLGNFPVRLPALGRYLQDGVLNVYFLAGDSDLLVRPERVRAASALLPGAKFHLLEGGHYQLLTPELGSWIAGKKAESSK